MKDFIRDDGKVRSCYSNEAKMNLIEYLWYHKELIPENTKKAINQLGKGMILIFAGILNLILLVFPIAYIISAYLNIRNAKKIVNKR